VAHAWINLRRRTYFVGPYSDTPEITIIGTPPYGILPEDCAPEELGRAIRVALNASQAEQLTWDDAMHAAAERTEALALAAGVKNRQTFERGTRLVDIDCARGDYTLTPYFRQRGYWEPSPESAWLHISQLSDHSLGESVRVALSAASA
jgi:hypothetical protein